MAKFEAKVTVLKLPGGLRMRRRCRKGRRGKRK